MDSASSPGSETEQLHEEQRKDWTRLDYLLKAAPSRILRVTEDLMCPVSTNCRPLCLVPPPEFQPQRMYLVPDLELIKFDDYRTLITRRAANLGVDLNASVDPNYSRLALAHDQLKYEFYLSEFDQRDCTLRMVLNGYLQYIGWRLGPELGFTGQNGEGFKYRSESPVRIGDFPTIQSVYEVGSHTRLLLIEITTLGAGQRIFSRLEEDIRKGGEDGVGVLETSGDGRCLIYRVSRLPQAD
jgi:hypothetical protein